MAPSRKPPRDVLRILRREVRFGCPAEGCGRPYLTWHHFDPPWRIENHHRPEGMIALCREHADKADNGSYTDDQLREFKRSGRSMAQRVGGKFDWLRRELVSVVGGTLYYRCPTILQVNSHRCIWFEEDDSGYKLLNFRVPAIGGQGRAQLTNNFWTVTTGVEEINSPPNGRTLEVRYRNGDRFRIEFHSPETASALVDRYPQFRREVVDKVLGDAFAEGPVTVASIWDRSAGLVDFSPTETRIGGVTMSGGVMSNIGKAALYLRVDPAVEARLFPGFSWSNWRLGRGT